MTARALVAAMLPLAFTALALAVAAAVVLAASFSRPAKGRHHPAPDPPARQGYGRLGRAGCLPLDTGLLEPAASNPPGAPAWDFAAQLRPPVADDPLNTGEFAALLARGRITPAQEAARLAARYFGNPEMIP